MATNNPVLAERSRPRELVVVGLVHHVGIGQRFNASPTWLASMPH